MKYFYFCLASFLLLSTPFSLLSQSVTFSPQRGFYTSPFQLTLIANPGTTIRYTTNGTAPTILTGSVYSSAINITTTTVIRAIEINGPNVSPVVTNTYLFLDSVLKQPANIAGWPNTTYDLGANGATAVQDYAMDPKVVNDPAYSGDMIAALKDIPTMSIVMDKNDFLTMYDGEAEFPTSVELIYPANPLANEQFNCGIESHSHLRLKRSMALTLDNTYFPSGLKSNILKNAPLNGPTASSFFTKSKIVLRAGNNRSWARNWNPNRTCYTRDQWYRDAQIDVSGIGSHGTFVHLYVNGLYWGLFNPCERLDAGFEASYKGGNFEDWMEFDQDGIRSGDPARFNYLIGPLVAKDMSVPANYNELKGYMDVANFSDYLMLTWMTGMQDWPQNNYAGGNSNNPVTPNQFLAWDCEWSWDTTNNSNNGAWVHPAFTNDKTGTGILTNLWHALRKNPDFMTVFADRVYRSCFNQGQLTDSVSKLRWQTLNNYISKAILGESARWGDAVGDGITRTKNDYWQPEVNRVDGLMNGNVQRFITALRAQGYYPSINPPDFSKEGGLRTGSLQLTMTNPGGVGTIYYTTNGDDPRLSGGALSSSAIIYTGAISIQNDVTIKARVRDGSVWSALHEGNYFAPNLKINEFMASNTSTLKDEFGVYDDWIEIYNNGSQPVDIGGMYITDLLTNPTQWKIPSTNPDLTTIPAHGFILLWADKETAQGPLHVDIKLSGSGEQIGLAVLDGTTPVYLDSLTFGAQTNDVSTGRFPDGSATFRTFNPATPGAANIVGQKTNGVFINEFMASNTTGNTDEFGEHDSWIEIYNKNPQPVDIGGLYVTNSLANPTLFQLPAGQPAATTIPANGFIVLWADNQTAQGARHLGFTLTAPSGEIGLIEKSGTDIFYVDSTRYTGQASNVSFGRYPDASVNFKSFTAPTPTGFNVLPAVTGLFINEFLASNDTGIKDENGENDDWFEIYNSTEQPVDIGGLFVTDNLANPIKWQIPTSRPDLTTIPAKGFKLLWADEQPSQGALHTNIKLSAGGEQLGLVQVNGTSTVFIDSLSFGAQKTDTSLGRYPNGSPNIVLLNHPSPGATNDTVPVIPNGTGFTLINSTTDQDIQVLNNGDILDLSKLTATRFNIRANTPANVISTIFNLTGTQTKSQTESTRPFSLFGDNNGNYNDWIPTAGSYTLRVTNYSGANGTGTVLATLTINFSVIDSVPVIPNGTGFTLINSTTDQDIQVLNNGDILDLSKLTTTRFNIRANTPANVVSTIFNLTGTQTRSQTESTRPFSLFGDNNGNYNDWIPTAGSYTLRVTNYSGANGTGTVLATLAINFSVITGTASNKAPTANAGPDIIVTLPETTAVLNGSGTDTDGTISGYSWAQMSGPNTATFNPNAIAKSPTLNGLAQGTYIFTLIVADNLGASSKPDSITVTVRPAVIVNQVSTFTLINSTTDIDISTLDNGNIVNLATVPGKKLNVRANTTGSVASVIFNLSGSQTKRQVESTTPYSLFGDINGNYTDWTFIPGSYTLIATPYTGGNGTGTAGTPLTINFTVIDQATAAIAQQRSMIEEPALSLTDAQAKVYPNPTYKGRFSILSPAKFRGEMSYTLLSAAGASLTSGKLTVGKPVSTMDFDFSDKMKASGLYYLILTGKEMRLKIKLIK